MKTSELTGYADCVYASEGAESYSADSCYFDSNWVTRESAKADALFAAYPGVNSFELQEAPDFALFKYQRGGGDDHYEFDWQKEGWRFYSTIFYTHGRVWLKFYQKHCDQIMEVQLK